MLDTTNNIDVLSHSDQSCNVSKCNINFAFCKESSQIAALWHNRFGHPSHGAPNSVHDKVGLAYVNVAEKNP
ncbi:hypothetical protein F8388_002008 [Cannabis sativa]|uniref:Uncharacterized protein n=1 Tax=Cannabis sativa TaxID=3483 RepID=A0A7J6FNY2_CANSA|nr:hypothetical protein F8388_002008 [Cannabis sativa]